MKSNIKYDLKTIKRLQVIVIILAVLMLAAISPMFFIKYGSVIMRRYLNIYILGVALFWPTVILGLVYLDGRIYLKNLQKAGYELPYDKRDYDGKVENLPRLFDVEVDNEGQCKDSLKLSTMAGIFTGGLLIVWMKYLYQWYIVDDSKVMLVYMSGLVLLWGIGAYTYYRQADNTKFRNLSEPEDGRKVRSSVARGIFTIVLCGIISVFLCSIPFSVTKYIAKTRALNDKENIMRFIHVLDQVCEERQLESDSPLYEQLSQGMEPFNSKWADEEILSLALERMDIEDIDELEDQLYMRDGRVWIKLVDGKIEASYTYLWEYGKPKTENYY